jgi:hypothetical protein
MQVVFAKGLIAAVPPGVLEWSDCLCCAWLARYAQRKYPRLFTLNDDAPNEAFLLRSEAILRVPLTHIHVLIGIDTVLVSTLRA